MFKFIKGDLLGKAQLSLQRSPHVRTSKTVLGSGFRARNSGLVVELGTLVGFRIPSAVFRIP